METSRFALNRHPSDLSNCGNVTCPDHDLIGYMKFHLPALSLFVATLWLICGSSIRLVGLLRATLQIVQSLQRLVNNKLGISFVNIRPFDDNALAANLKHLAKEHEAGVEATSTVAIDEAQDEKNVNLIRHITNLRLHSSWYKRCKLIKFNLEKLDLRGDIYRHIKPLNEKIDKDTIFPDTCPCTSIPQLLQNVPPLSCVLI